MKYKVVEIFTSINGEGQRAGELALFIRFAGCNLNCNYCDTVWANELDVEYMEMTEQELVLKIRESGIRNVTLTGGEPLIQKGMKELLESFSILSDVRIEIETNGSISIEEYRNVPNRPSFTLDYKLPGSGMNAYMNMDNYNYLLPEDTVKFVVSDRNDLNQANRIIKEYKLQGKCGIYLSPVFGRIEPAEIVDYMVEHKMNQVHVQLQLHKFIWDPMQRGV